MNNKFIIGPLVYKKFAHLGKVPILHFKRRRHFISNDIAKDVTTFCCNSFIKTDTVFDINDFEDYNSIM
jgi:hypothetical protein